MDQTWLTGNYRDFFVRALVPTVSDPAIRGGTMLTMEPGTAPRLIMHLLLPLENVRACLGRKCTKQQLLCLRQTRSALQTH